MTIKITVWNQNQYTKKGKLKKNAKSEAGFMFADVEPLTEGATDKWLKEVAERLKEDYSAFESPYIFTHLSARNKAGERVLIFEEVGVKDGYICTSPVKLRELVK